MKEHDKKYPNSKTTATRYQIFLKNLKYIRETNAKRSGYRLGLNKFADMSSDEFKRVFLRQLPTPTTNHSTARFNNVQRYNCAPPASVDWREKGVVTPVKNQGRCGSCWAFGTTGAIESINAINTGELFPLSEQELVDCDSVSRGCSGGYTQRAFEWIIKNGGISEDAVYPYRARDGVCKANNMQNRGRVVKINSYEKVPRSDEALLCATAQQPITVALDATYIQLYKDGIFDGGNCKRDSTYINHAVLIVGYGSNDGKDYWIVKNSWKENWGSNGYFFIQRNTNWPNGVCAINTAAYVPNI
ncbi:hypothetical protein QN277_005932 [Acacia crassicarpa]|nr:hypothetical protein QN277_005932 [Acacia crassicarpa]